MLPVFQRLLFFHCFVFVTIGANILPIIRRIRSSLPPRGHVVPVKSVAP
jgi:hypothetical protein